ncbi:MAG TPA: glycosyltransferase [Tepidisphaeraceae bacterium]|jgi:glycosyltransferase involved in cell wall biosynthesis|nr:glycosyltransferase [Tepidisphaeraceae bacterium]
MKIGIELRQVTFGASGGLAQHLQGMLQAAFREYPEHRFTVFCTIFSRSLIDRNFPNVQVLTIPAFSFFSRIEEAAANGEIDVLFRTYPMESSLRMPWHRQIVMIPDIQHEIYPEFFEPAILSARTLAFNQALARAGALVTSTDYVRGTILAHPWTRCRDIFLAAPSLPPHWNEPADLTPDERANIPPQDFLFYPANLWPHKNHRRLLEAFARLIKDGHSARLILTGHREGWENLRDRFPGLPVAHLGFVREPMLKALLKSARALAFFSLHEGFGIPLLEAFATGTPVICSNTTSLPEVGGDAVLSCDPTDVDAMQSLMRRILSDRDLSARLAEHGKKRLSPYTPEIAAKGFIDACIHVAAVDKPVEVKTPLPLVTIVTPSYNQGRFLRATIDSVLTQSYPNIEYIVMDGGSSDESVEILKSYGDRFFWISEKDGGQAAAINAGMARAKGEILAFLNSDDVLLPGAIQRVVDHFRDNPECDMVYGRARYIDAAGHVTGQYRTDDYSFQRLMHDCCVCQPAAFWQARIARKIGPFDASLHLALDYDYWLRIDRAGGRIQHIHDILADSRLYPDTKTLSMRNQSYTESFAVCMKHGGYVDYNYFQGLWHHLVTERAIGWPRFFKSLPGSFLLLAWMHHKVFEARRCGTKKLAAQLFDPIVSGIGRMPIAGQLVSHGMRIVRSRKAPARIEGFLSDNWMAPNARITVQPKASGQRLRHVGFSPLDMQVTVKADDKILGAYPLLGGKVQAIGEDIPFPQDRAVVLQFHFSGYTVDGANRHLSFLVTETNLFGENDA